MPDASTTPPAAAPGDDSGKKTTTRMFIIPPKPGRPNQPPAPPHGIQPGPPPEHKSQTMRISLDDILPGARPPPDSRQVTMPITELISGARPPPDSRQVTMPITELISGARPPLDSRQVTMPITEFAPGAAAVPPTIQLKRPAAFHGAAKATPEAPPMAAKPKTGPPNTPAATSPAEEGGSKKGTSRLILDAGQNAVPGAEVKRSTSPITVIPQTIRLKRAGGPTLPPPTVKARTDALSAAPTVGRTADLSQAKMVTARIMVEETTAADAESQPPITPVSAGQGASNAAAPRTIRLKKPSDPGLEEAADEGRALESPTVRKSLKRETSKIALPAAEAPAPITQRKTIKIKRTEPNAEPRTVKIQAASAAAAPGLPQVGRAAAEDEGPGPLFIVLAAVALVVIACLAYIMAAQAFGPELSLPVPASLL